MTKNLVLTVAMALAAGVPAAHAQTLHPAPGSATSGPSTSIDALVERALADAPDIRAAWARVDAAKGSVRQSAARVRPELMTEQRNEWGGMNTQTSIGVSWPLEIGRRDGRIAVAIDSAAESALAANEQARQVAARVRIAAIRALAADAVVRIVEASVEAHHQLCDVLAARVAAGSAAPLDRDMAEVELRQGQVSLTRLRADAAARWAELKGAAGLDASTPLSLTESLEEAVTSLRRRDVALMAAAVADRADVARADAAVEIAAAKVDQARRDGRLDLRLNATYMRSSIGFPQLGMTAGGAPAPIENRMNEIAIGATVTFPSGNDGRRAAAAAEKRAAEFDRDARLLAARAEVASAQARDSETGRALEIYAGGLMDLAAKNLDVVRQSFQLGRVSRAEVIAEEQRYREVQTGRVAALLDAYEARVMLTQALGGSR